MARTIRTQLLLQSLLTIALALGLVVAMVSVALWRLGTDQAGERLALAGRALAQSLAAGGRGLQDSALRITGDKDLTSKANFLQESAGKADLASMVGLERAALAVRLGRAVAAAGAADGSLYAADGGLICACRSEGDRLRLVVPDDARPGSLLGVALAAGQEPQPGDWKPVEALPTAPLRLAGTAATGAGLAVRAGAWRIEATAPVKVESLNPTTFQMELVPRGLLNLGLPVDDAFLAGEAGRTGVRVNLYAGATLAAGGAAGFIPAAVPRASERAPADGPDTAALAIASAEVGGDPSFVAVAPMRAAGTDAGSAAFIISQADMRRSVRWVVLLTLAAGAVAAVAAILLGMVMSRSITRPLAGTVDILRAMAAGDTSRRLPEDGPREVAELARAANHTVDGLQQTLDRTVAVADQLGGDAGRLDGSATAAADAATRIAERGGAVSGQATQVSAAAQAVAAAAGEMTASIQEIARNSAAATQVANEAAAEAKAADTTVARLGTSSRDIDAVVATIAAIAEQTNLLALNATIEAARAGDAGRGFAVVASEVKSLARQAAEAAEDVAKRVHALQGDSTAAVQGIARITGVIGRINELQAAVAAAVEQQAAATGEITRSATGASDGATAIATAIAEVANAAEQGRTGAAETRAAAERLLRLAHELRSVAGTTSTGLRSIR